MPNRVLLYDRIEINDRLGHEAGDELLVAVAARLCASVRDIDTVARLGGDEFIVLCEGLDNVQRPSMVADRIIASLSQPFLLRRGAASVSASVGITVAHGGDAPRDLLLRADVAMYAAKQGGRGRHETAALVGSAATAAA